jgi:hypothetical protein
LRGWRCLRSFFYGRGGAREFRRRCGLRHWCDCLARLYQSGLSRSGILDGLRRLDGRHLTEVGLIHNPYIAAGNVRCNGGSVAQ